MAGSRRYIIKAWIVDPALLRAVDSRYRVTRDWRQVKAAGQLRCRFETAEQWREEFSGDIDYRKSNGK